MRTQKYLRVALQAFPGWSLLTTPRKMDFCPYLVLVRTVITQRVDIFLGCHANVIAIHYN